MEENNNKITEILTLNPGRVPSQLLGVPAAEDSREVHQCHRSGKVWPAQGVNFAKLHLGQKKCFWPSFFILP
jgi:hypothetical protein